mmetsp:Transcript_25495/g.74341  ORF Transcript_25495/g.74341 Transcript_25495/m.74341 type:complete len:243 (-) Transcript_25495:690-1418(-)
MLAHFLVSFQLLNEALVVCTVALHVVLLSGSSRLLDSVVLELAKRPTPPLRLHAIELADEDHLWEGPPLLDPCDVSVVQICCAHVVAEDRITGAQDVAKVGHGVELGVVHSKVGSSSYLHMCQARLGFEHLAGCAGPLRGEDGLNAQDNVLNEPGGRHDAAEARLHPTSEFAVVVAVEGRPVTGQRINQVHQPRDPLYQHQRRYVAEGLRKTHWKDSEVVLAEGNDDAKKRELEVEDVRMVV